MAVKELATVFSIRGFLSNLHPRSNVLTRFFLDFVRYSKQILIRYVIWGYDCSIPYPFKFIHHSAILRYTRVSQMKTLNSLYFLSWTIRCADPWLISKCAAISFTVTRRFPFTVASTAAMASGVTTGCAWPGRGESVAELMPFMNFLVHSYTCCSDRHASPYWTFIRRRISMGFTPSLIKKLKKNGLQNAVLLWFMLQAGPLSLHHYYAVMLHSCIVLPPVGHSSNHQYHCCQLTNNRAVFRIVIALLRFSFDCPSYIDT